MTEDDAETMIAASLGELNFLSTRSATSRNRAAGRLNRTLPP
jgi:hypothetical protein